jgi:hypothetical protein
MYYIIDVVMRTPVLLLLRKKEKRMNKILKLEELNLEEIRGIEFENRIEAFETLRKLNKAISYDARTSDFRMNGEHYVVRFKKQNGRFVLDHIMTNGDIEETINENGIKCVRQWCNFYK